MSISSPGSRLQLADSKGSTPFSSGSVGSSLPIIEREKPVVQQRNSSYATEEAIQLSVSLRERLLHFTWAWYTLTMSTGGTALLRASQPHGFRGLHEISIVVFSLNVAFFVIISCIMAARFIIHGGLLQSLKHPKEGLFFATALLSIATLITGLARCFDSENAPRSLTITLEVLFWLYCAASFTLAVTQYSYVFSSVAYRLQAAMTAWVLPCFPIMLAGAVASNFARFQPDRSTIPIVIAGVTFNGLGIMVTFMVYTLFFARLIEHGLPDREARPAMFICVGPPSFGALAFLGIAHDLTDFLDVMNSSDTFFGSKFYQDALSNDCQLVMGVESLVLLHHGRCDCSSTANVVEYDAPQHWL